MTGEFVLVLVACLDQQPHLFEDPNPPQTRNLYLAESHRNNLEAARGCTRGFTVCCVLVEQLFKTAVATISLTMLKSKTFVKKTRSGGVLKIVREHYLRDDIWCGSEVCKECKDEAPVLQEETCIESNLCPYPHYLIPDTNVVLHQQFRCRVWCFNPKIYNEGSIKLTEHQLK
nr:uncharacterized protein LOC103911231 isoform X3 [Danio rerio]|eukprot:XP_021329766.1 uncharacterized protein LOC103911231 isoform X3 [Danio rerio]